MRPSNGAYRSPLGIETDKRSKKPCKLVLDATAIVTSSSAVLSEFRGHILKSAKAERFTATVLRESFDPAARPD
jgi:hypothetical protein